MLQPGGADVGESHPANMRGKAVQGLLVAWLNVASGAIGLEEPSPIGATVLETLYTFEDILADPMTGLFDHFEVLIILDDLTGVGCPPGGP